MGKKSRLKKERKQASNTHRVTFDDYEQRRKSSYDAADQAFEQNVKKLTSILGQYDLGDAAVSIAISDLWPSNIGSPFKHLLGLSILAQTKPTNKVGRRVATYDDFKKFSESLISAYPDFWGMEDMVPERDWGEIRTMWRSECVPMFYGTSLERTPDFVTAFSITNADNQQALSDMRLALAIQGLLIERIPSHICKLDSEITSGHIEVPSEEFWQASREVLLRAKDELQLFRVSASGKMEIEIGAYDEGVSRNEFATACMEGKALPFLALTFGELWIPIAIRNGPSSVIEKWSGNDMAPITEAMHRSLSLFFRDRFINVVPGPSQICIGSEEFSLPISTIILEEKIWIIVLCRHNQITTHSRQIEEILSAVRPGVICGFRRGRGRRVQISTGGELGASPEDINVLLVPILNGTGMRSIAAPKKPTQLWSLSDLITIFDSVDDLNELERFRKYVDQMSNLWHGFTGVVDHFGSFRDSDEVLVAGADRPTMIMLDPHWGSSWRYQTLEKFWSDAPRFFPNGSIGWRLDKYSSGIVEMTSRGDDVQAFSVLIGESTLQVSVRIDRSCSEIENRLLNLFAQVLVDCCKLCTQLLIPLQLFQRSHIVIQCEIDMEHRVDDAQNNEEKLENVPIISFSKKSRAVPWELSFHINTAMVQKGLLRAANAEFEINSLIEMLQHSHAIERLDLDESVLLNIRATAERPPRFVQNRVQQPVDSLDYVEPIIPKAADYKLARKRLAEGMQQLGMNPGRYELMEAKKILNASRNHLSDYIESQIGKYKIRDLIHACLEQQEALLTSERLRIYRIEQSLKHEVDYDRNDAIKEARVEFGGPGRHYIYLLEKALSTKNSNGTAQINADVLRELIGLIDWYKVLAGASDVLHNSIGVGGIEIDDSYIPEVFYSGDWEIREQKFNELQANIRLGVDVAVDDAVDGDLEDELGKPALVSAFKRDAGFELLNLLRVLHLLAQPVRHRLVEKVALSHKVDRETLIRKITEALENLSVEECVAIIDFLTISATSIRRLPDRNIDESDVPFWEHKKRLHRITIRPFVSQSSDLHWGVEMAHRAINIWRRAVVDGYLPADFPWPNVEKTVRAIKENIEKRLELKTEEIFLRHTPYVLRGIDFAKKFRDEGFADVGDYDVLAYWPDSNTLIGVECKYNQPAFCLKDAKRLRDRIFASDDMDRKGQFSRIVDRRKFAHQHRERMLELLKWPKPSTTEGIYEELYISRDMHWWLVHPPYNVPTNFVRVDLLDSWLKKHS